jgi:membrane protein YqaA with SNARE-associated domain
LPQVCAAGRVALASVLTPEWPFCPGFVVKPVFLAIVLAIVGSAVGMAVAFWIGRRYLHAIVQEEIQVCVLIVPHAALRSATCCLSAPTCLRTMT